MSRQEYINKYRNIAVEQMNKYGIPASIILAQACLESGDGNSRLATKANNHFGIKCGNNWKGKTISHRDDSRGECFRKYRKVEDSYKDHSEFLRKGIRYQSLFDLNSNDYKSWAHGLKAAGYATDPKYARLLIEIIEQNKLYEYDNKKGATKHRKATICTAAGNINNAITASPIYKYSFDRQIYSDNGTPYIIATGIETYSSLAKEYNLFESEILKFNDLKKKEVKGDQKIKAGTIVYIGKRKK
ncbi:MAG: glucosaminidase domain-containing protein [Bacteroidales bacterium]|nr:glucosaminidase domain-containing protein [Bacteroidales bacterium]